MNSDDILAWFINRGGSIRCSQGIDIFGASVIVARRGFIMATGSGDTLLAALEAAQQDWKDSGCE